MPCHPPSGKGSYFFCARSPLGYVPNPLLIARQGSAGPEVSQSLEACGAVCAGKLGRSRWWHEGDVAVTLVAFCGQGGQLGDGVRR